MVYNKSGVWNTLPIKIELTQKNKKRIELVFKSKNLLIAKWLFCKGFFPDLIQVLGF
jgi:hypothetical protein